MKNKDYLYIILVAVILFVPLFLRPLEIPFILGDPYYYANFIFNGVSLHLHHIGVTTLFGLLPASVFLINLTMLLLTVACGVIFYKTVNLIKEKQGLVATILMYSLLWFNWIFLKFENDLFGFVFVLLSIYFLVKYRQKSFDKKLFNINIILSLFFLGFGMFIWGFAVYYLYLFLLISGFHLLYVLGVLSTFIFLPKIIGHLFAFNSVAENKPIVGLFVLLFVGFLYLKKYRLKYTWFCVLLGTFFVTINLKFIYILIPILLLNFSNIDFTNKNVKNFLFCLISFGLITTVYQTVFLFPSYSDYELFRVSQTDDIFSAKSTYYSWSVGYFVKYHGVDQNHFGYPPRDQENYFVGKVYTLKQDPFIMDCEIISSAKNTVLVNCGG